MCASWVSCLVVVEVWSSVFCFVFVFSFFVSKPRRRDNPFWNVWHGVSARQRSFGRGGRFGLRGHVQLSLSLRQRMPFVLLFCVRSGMCFWFWWRRVISNAPGLGIAMVGWMSSLDIFILVT